MPSANCSLSFLLISNGRKRDTPGRGSRRRYERLRPYCSTLVARGSTPAAAASLAAYARTGEALDTQAAIDAQRLPRDLGLRNRLRLVTTRVTDQLPTIPQCTSTGDVHNVIVLYRRTVHMQSYSVDQSQEPPPRLRRPTFSLSRSVKRSSFFASR